MVAPVVLSAGFLLLAAWYLWAGVGLGADTARYVDGAARLLDGAPLAGKQANYLSYIGLLAAAEAVGGGLPLVVAVQVAFGGLAVLAAWDLGRSLGGPIAGGFAGAVLALNPALVQWHRFVLTDSLYISCLTLSVWALVRVRLRPLRLLPVLPLAALLTFTVLLRPNGWLLVPLAILYLFHRAGVTRGRMVTVGVLLLTGLVSAAALVRPLRRAVDAESPATMLTRGVVVWGYTPWELDMPGEAITPAEPWTRGIDYAFRHPLATARLVAARIGACLAHVRPYWSTRHNFAAAAALIPFYLLALTGWLRVRRASDAKLIAAAMLAHVLLVGLTFADWDGRFLLHVLPLMGVFAGVGAQALVGTSPRVGPPELAASQPAP